MLNDSARRELLAVARASLEASTQGRQPAVPSASAALQNPTGAFVTLRHRGVLRGCIGHIECDQPLVQVVTRCAMAAALEDPRFRPVDRGELGGIDIEISVLGQVEKVDDPEAIEVGRDGLIVEQGNNRGLLLPQVATEWAWDRATFLAQTCLKAGLPADAWKRGAQIFRFQAEVFGEKDVN